MKAEPISKQTVLRTALFVPGTRPERFMKALASGADAVIIDLEDSVEPSAKILAREHIKRFAAANSQARFLIRINDAASIWFAEDLGLCARLRQATGLVLPKAESAVQVAQAARFSGKPIFPIIESARGIGQMNDIAATPLVERMTFGALDLMLDLGMTPDTNGAQFVLNEIRYQLLVTSRLHKLCAPLDTVYADFGDMAGLEAAAHHARAMGFGGMLCIHPKQVAVVHRAFAPPAEEVAWARRVVQRADTTGASAFEIDNKMIDRPAIERARRTLRFAAE